MDYFLIFVSLGLLAITLMVYCLHEAGNFPRFWAMIKNAYLSLSLRNSFWVPGTVVVGLIFLTVILMLDPLEYQIDEEIPNLVFVMLGIINLILLFFVVYFDAKAHSHFTFLEEGTVTAFVRGDTLLKFESRVQEGSDYYHVITNRGKKGTLKKSKKNPAGWLERNLGPYFVSVLYPYTRQYSMLIDARKIKDLEASQIGEVLDSRRKKIWNLRWKFPRPILVKEIELKDQFRVDVIVFATFQVVNPYLPFFVFKGSFFDILDAAVESGLIDTLRELTYSELQAIKKGKSGIKEKASQKDLKKAMWFTEQLLQINNTGHVPDMPDGIEEGVGIKIADAFIFRFNLSEKDSARAEALQAKETKKLLAEGVREKAKGDADAIRTVALAEGIRFVRLVGTQKRLGVTPDVAAETVRSILTAEQVSGEKSKITTWVTDGSRALVSVPANQPSNKGDTS
ncbi:MAG: hypothetical protein WD003_01880 [Candidatus Paceibacterota bacterium]